VTSGGRIDGWRNRFIASTPGCRAANLAQPKKGDLKVQKYGEIVSIFTDDGDVDTALSQRHPLFHDTIFWIFFK